MNSVMKGNMGEYYALAELSRRGWTAAQTARNTRNYDILAKKDSRQIAVRVKTKTSDARVFQWNAKREGKIFAEITEHDFSVLVDIPESHQEIPQFYIVPTRLIDDWLQTDFKTWLRTPGRNNSVHDPKNPRRMMYLDDDHSKVAHGYRLRLNPYLAKWNLLEGDSN